MDNAREELLRHTFTTKMKTKFGSNNKPQMLSQHVRLKKSTTQYQEILSQTLLSHQSHQDHQCHLFGSWKEELNQDQCKWWWNLTISNLRLWNNGMQIPSQLSIKSWEEVVLIADLTQMVLDLNAWKVTVVVLPRTTEQTTLKFAISLLRKLMLAKMRSREPSSAVLKDFSWWLQPSLCLLASFEKL